MGMHRDGNQISTRLVILQKNNAQIDVNLTIAQSIRKSGISRQSQNAPRICPKVWLHLSRRRMPNLAQATAHQNLRPNQNPRCAKAQVTQANRCVHPRLANTIAKRTRLAARTPQWRAKAPTANRCANARKRNQPVNTHKCDGAPTVAFFISRTTLLTRYIAKLPQPSSNGE